MNKIILDYSFLKSLLLNNDERHELAEEIASKFHSDYTFYIPLNVFVKTMSLCDAYNDEIKETVLFTLFNLGRIQFITKKDIYTGCLKNYTDISGISYSDCLTVEYMKEKEIHNIISFNERLDQIKGVNRIFGFDKYNKNRLNILKYEDTDPT